MRTRPCRCRVTDNCSFTFLRPSKRLWTFAVLVGRKVSKKAQTSGSDSRRLVRPVLQPLSDVGKVGCCFKLWFLWLWWICVHSAPGDGGWESAVVSGPAPLLLAWPSGARLRRGAVLRLWCWNSAGAYRYTNRRWPKNTKWPCFLLPL